MQCGVLQQRRGSFTSTAGQGIGRSLQREATRGQQSTTILSREATQTLRVLEDEHSSPHNPQRKQQEMHRETNSRAPNKQTNHLTNKHTPTKQQEAPPHSSCLNSPSGSSRSRCRVFLVAQQQTLTNYTQSRTSRQSKGDVTHAGRGAAHRWSMHGVCCIQARTS